jgi:cystathionine beta-lyase/cystathionine gamma-synthase
LSILETVTNGRADIMTAEADLNAVPEQVADLCAQFDSCLRELGTAGRQIEDYLAYCVRNGLQVDESISTQLVDATTQAAERISRHRTRLLTSAVADSAELLTVGESVLRFTLATLSYVRHSLEWVASSYAQSHAVQFFDLRSQGSQEMNYDRNGTHASVTRVERQLQETLGLPVDAFTVQLAASGMAAFTLLESFLVRDRLQPGDTVLLAPYVYYESWQQLTALPFVRIEQARGYGVDDVVADVLKLRPKCLFVDPIANNSRQRMIDLPELFRRLRGVVTERLTVVVDGTMIAGALPSEVLASDSKLEILYYESCTKYLQLGMDATQAGLVAFPVELAFRMDELRRNGGAVLYRQQAELFPRYDRALLHRRMRRISANAERLANLLDSDPRVRSVGTVWHPGLVDHPDVELAKSLLCASGVVTFLFHDYDHNTKEELNELCDEMIVRARDHGVQLTKGVSFGYSVPRLWVQDITDDDPWFVRLNVGDRGYQLDLLAEVMAGAIASGPAKWARGQLAA